MNPEPESLMVPDLRQGELFELSPIALPHRSAKGAGSHPATVIRTVCATCGCNVYRPTWHKSGPSYCRLHWTG